MTSGASFVSLRASFVGENDQTSRAFAKNSPSVLEVMTGRVAAFSDCAFLINLLLDKGDRGVYRAPDRVVGHTKSFPVAWFC
jgi:hypothetical protein